MIAFSNASTLRTFSSILHGEQGALNLSASPQKVNYELKKNGFDSAKPLVTSGKSSSSGDFVSLDAYGVFIGQLVR